MKKNYIKKTKDISKFFSFPFDPSSAKNGKKGCPPDPYGDIHPEQSATLLPTSVMTDSISFSSRLSNNRLTLI
jgi:hypothetical protein